MTYLDSDFSWRTIWREEKGKKLHNNRTLGGLNSSWGYYKGSQGYCRQDQYWSSGSQAPGYPPHSSAHPLGPAQNCPPYRDHNLFPPYLQTININFSTVGSTGIYWIPSAKFTTIQFSILFSASTWLSNYPYSVSWDPGLKYATAVWK